MRQSFLLAALAAASLTASVASATALPTAKLFLNLKLTATGTIDADAVARDFCVAHGYGAVASYKNRLVVQSGGYVLFAALRCTNDAGAAS